MRRARWVLFAALAVASVGEEAPEGRLPWPAAWVLVAEVDAPVRLAVCEREGALVERAVSELAEAAVGEGWAAMAEPALGGVELARGKERWVVVVSAARPGWLRALALRAEAPDAVVRRDDEDQQGGTGR